MNDFKNDTNREVALTNNELAFIALCNEYCSALENAAMTAKTDFVDNMLRLLPRIYISAFDIKPDLTMGEGGYISPALTEEIYDRIVQNIAGILGEDDTFLEVFERDMIYSDTPIATTVSESLADIFQPLYDFLETCRDAPNDLIKEAIAAVRESFEAFWGQSLTNVMRALNAIKFE